MSEKVFPVSLVSYNEFENSTMSSFEILNSILSGEWSYEIKNVTPGKTSWMAQVSLHMCGFSRDGIALGKDMHDAVEKALRNAISTARYLPKSYITSTWKSEEVVAPSTNVYVANSPIVQAVVAEAAATIQTVETNSVVETPEEVPQQDQGILKMTVHLNISYEQAEKLLQLITKYGIVGMDGLSKYVLSWDPTLINAKSLNTNNVDSFMSWLNNDQEGFTPVEVK